MTHERKMNALPVKFFQTLSEALLEAERVLLAPPSHGQWPPCPSNLNHSWGRHKMLDFHKIKQVAPYILFKFVRVAMVKFVL
jgi:hypothetical protein